MRNLFEIIGEDFFKPFTSLFKEIYVDCLNIIYDAYRSELSYGADREILVAKLTDYKEGFRFRDFEIRRRVR